MKSVELILADETATTQLARQLAGAARPGDVLALTGDLGSGKTTLARAFIRALTTPEEEVPSPTFTLVQTYDCDIGTIWHFDLYRLARAEDAVELDIEEAFAEGISLIEWPERLGAWLPAGALHLALSAGAGTAGRRVRLTGGERWSKRLSEMFGG